MKTILNDYIDVVELKKKYLKRNKKKKEYLKYFWNNDIWFKYYLKKYISILLFKIKRWIKI